MLVDVDGVGLPPAGAEFDFLEGEAKFWKMLSDMVFCVLQKEHTFNIENYCTVKIEIFDKDKQTFFKNNF